VASRNRRNITGSGTPEKSHSAYRCEVAGGNSLAELWDDSSVAEALGFLTAGTQRLRRALCTAASVLEEAAYAVVAPRRPRGNLGPETARSPIGATAVLPVIASRCEAMRSSPSALLLRLSRALTGASTTSKCWRARSVHLGGRRGVSSGCDGNRVWLGRPLRTEFVAVGDAHEVDVPCGLKVQAPEPDFEPGWEGVRAAHGISLAAVLGANHHREGWWS
jgi:hypothetical protein